MIDEVFGIVALLTVAVSFGCCETALQLFMRYRFAIDENSFRCRATDVQLMADSWQDRQGFTSCPASSVMTNAAFWFGTTVQAGHWKTFRSLSSSVRYCPVLKHPASAGGTREPMCVVKLSDPLAPDPVATTTTKAVSESRAAKSIRMGEGLGLPVWPPNPSSGGCVCWQCSWCWLSPPTAKR